MSEEKYIDESWKETATEEKENLEKINQSSSNLKKENPEEKLGSSLPQQEELHPRDHSKEAGNFEMNFVNYITSLAFQTMIFLGEIPNPITNKTDPNLDQAKFLIDTLTMLREKTKGNLSKQESNLLDASIYELQMKYIEVKQSENRKN